MAQRTSLAACHRFHTIGPRLARWLLMTQDRSDASSFHVTHQYLAYLLGVRRVGITTAAGSLQRKGLITYHRGEVKVLDRGGLAAVACSCYAADRAVYSTLMSCERVCDRPGAAGLWHGRMLKVRAVFANAPTHGMWMASLRLRRF
jgi:hypothetical protein